MIITKVITILMAVFFVLGAIDRLIGNRFGLGKEFERGFMIIGPMTLSILGLLMLAPVLAEFLQKLISPVFGLIGVDTDMFPGMLMSSEISYPPGRKNDAERVSGPFRRHNRRFLHGRAYLLLDPAGHRSHRQERLQTLFRRDP